MTQTTETDETRRDEAAARGDCSATDTPRPSSVTDAPRPTQSSGVDANLLRQRWPEVLETLGRLRRVTWVLVSQNAQVVDVTETTVKLGFTTQALANTFANGPHTDYVREAIAQTLGATLTVEPVLGNSGGVAEAPARGSSQAASSASGPRDSRPTSWDSPPPNQGATAPSWEPEPNHESQPQASVHAVSVDEEAEEKPHRPWERAAAPSEIDENGDALPDNVRHLPAPTPVGAEFEESSEDDEILENSDSVGIPLVQREMGGEIIEEIEE